MSTDWADLSFHFRVQRGFSTSADALAVGLSGSKNALKSLIQGEGGGERERKKGTIEERVAKDWAESNQTLFARRTKLDLL